MGIARLRALKYEAESAFCTENGAHSWTDVHCIDPVITAAQLHHEHAENVQRITQYAGQTLGRKSDSRLTFGNYLCGDGDALLSGVTGVDDSLQALLKLSMGGSRDGEGTLTAAGCSTTVLNVAAGRGAQFVAGGALMVEDAGGEGYNEIGLIESVSTDAITLKHALSNAVDAGKIVWNAYTAYIDPSATDTGQFQALGDDSADIWLMLGSVGGFTISDLLQVEAGQLPKINFDMLVTDWSKDSGTLAASTYDGGALLGTTSEMEIHYQTHGTTTRNLISVSQLDVVPGHVWTPLRARGNSDKQHTGRIRMTGVVPTATFTADPSAAFWTAHAAQTDKALAICFGRTAGQSWCIELPNCELSAVPTRAMHAEQIATQVTLRAKEDDCGSADNALTRSPIRIHRL